MALPLIRNAMGRIMNTQPLEDALVENDCSRWRMVEREGYFKEVTKELTIASAKIQ